MALRTADTATPEAIQKLAEDVLVKTIRIKQLEEALEKIANSPTWSAKTTCGKAISHTYAFATVDIARRALSGEGG